ncbi:hypothetical protein H2O64_02950 [Kordia sp. YSTF-M3]|uniref:Uncharacterized protein n=1 Tax=Kordia aestuariivivens TaxID=2759037 RepID=A0ABR7Q4W3_9FLAO|nr:hypothetical protein [Kordia aestuariivivens]MBC8753614.1 hypothetical protein [Kordia aestuariivivens]
MKLLKSIDKLLASMGSSKAAERGHSAAITEKIMKDVPGELLATSEYGGIWAGLQELNGYVFMEVTILNPTKIKTFTGSTLTFLGGDELVLTSDSKEINSEYSGAYNSWITLMSFEITKKNLAFIKGKKFDQIQLDFKKKSLLFDAKK